MNCRNVMFHQISIYKRLNKSQTAPPRKPNPTATTVSATASSNKSATRLPALTPTCTMPPTSSPKPTKPIPAARCWKRICTTKAATKPKNAQAARSPTPAARPVPAAACKPMATTASTV